MDGNNANKPKGKELNEKQKAARLEERKKYWDKIERTNKLSQADVAKHFKDEWAKMEIPLTDAQRAQQRYKVFKCQPKNPVGMAIVTSKSFLSMP